MDRLRELGQKLGMLPQHTVEGEAGTTQVQLNVPVIDTRGESQDDEGDQDGFLFDSNAALKAKAKLLQRTPKSATDIVVDGSIDSSRPIKPMTRFTESEMADDHLSESPARSFDIPGPSNTGRMQQLDIERQSTEGYTKERLFGKDSSMKFNKIDLQSSPRPSELTRTRRFIVQSSSVIKPAVLRARVSMQNLRRRARQPRRANSSSEIGHQNELSLATSPDGTLVGDVIAEDVSGVSTSAEGTQAAENFEHDNLAPKQDSTKKTAGDDQKCDGQSHKEKAPSHDGASKPGRDTDDKMEHRTSTKSTKHPEADENAGKTINFMLPYPDITESSAVIQQLGTIIDRVPAIKPELMAIRSTILEESARHTSARKEHLAKEWKRVHETSIQNIKFSTELGERDIHISRCHDTIDGLQKQNELLRANFEEAALERDQAKESMRLVEQESQSFNQTNLVETHQLKKDNQALRSENAKLKLELDTISRSRGNYSLPATLRSAATRASDANDSSSFMRFNSTSGATGPSGESGRRRAAANTSMPTIGEESRDVTNPIVESANVVRQFHLRNADRSRSVHVSGTDFLSLVQNRGQETRSAAIVVTPNPEDDVFGPATPGSSNVSPSDFPIPPTSTINARGTLPPFRLPPSYTGNDVFGFATPGLSTVSRSDVPMHPTSTRSARGTLPPFRLPPLNPETVPRRRPASSYDTPTNGQNGLFR